MTLLPGSFSSKIRVCFHKKRFVEDSTENFEALSYAWGSTENLVSIFVGKAGRQTIQVTRHLADALPYLRHPKKPRVLWIDTICVNQQNLEERSSQVKRMPDIYSKATRVVVWLGLESDDSTRALECAKTISSNISVDWIHGTMTPLSSHSEAHWSDAYVPLPFDNLQAQSICKLFNCSWFRRLWVWQEVFLARDVVAMCGSESIPWKVFSNTIVCFTHKTQTPGGTYLSTANEQLLLGLCRKRKLLPLDSVMQDTQHAVCSDPRDKIFAILSLVREPGEVKVEPDYTKTPVEVYRDVFTKYINAGYVRYLASVEIHEQIDGAPSWVPDWSQPKLAPRLRNLNAAGDFYSEAKFQDFATLQITGVCLADIESVEAFAFNDEKTMYMDELLLELQRVLERLGIDGESLPSQQKLLELCEVLCCGQYEERFSLGGRARPALEVCLNVLKKMLKAQLDEILLEGDIKNEAIKFLQHVENYGRGRSLFRSGDGNFGMAPKSARSGDVISIMLGLNTALILRRIGNHNYQIVGEAYYHGAMNGEALLGPLPDAFKPIWCRDPEGSRYPAYFNQRDRNITAEDPRWPELPPSWRLVKRKDDVPLFICEATGEETEMNPGLTCEWLEKRGVKLQVFNII